jgi:hypothetical protein
MNAQRSLLFAILAAACLCAGPSATASAEVPRPSFVNQPTVPQEGIADYTSLALDAAGRARVAWFDPTRGALAYAVQAPAGWRSEVVDASGRVGWYASLALDSHGHEAIAYYDVTHGALKFASRDGGAWTTVTVEASDDGVGHYCSLAFDPQDEPAISYYDAHELSLKLARRSHGAWSIETVDGAGNADAMQAVVESAAAAGPAPDPGEDVPNVGLYSSLAFDRQGRAFISYQDVANADLKVAFQQDGAWRLEVVDAEGDVGEHTSLKLDAGGNPSVAYYDLQNGALKFAERHAGAWHTEAVDATGDVGAYASLALGTKGEPSISYQDASHQALRFAARHDGMWMVETVDARGRTGRNTSLALDRAGNPVIAYTVAARGAFRLISASVLFAGRPGEGDGAALAPSLAAWPLPYRGGELHVSFTLPRGRDAGEVALLDLVGRRVRTLHPGAVASGRAIMAWDGRDEAGRDVPGGVYFLVSGTREHESRLKLVVLR